MIIVPKEKALTEKLNIYYLDVEKLIEHQQGEVGAGELHFMSPAAEGVVFFDQDDVLGGYFKEKDDVFHGTAAVKRIFEAADQYNFTVDIYRIRSDHIYFWATMPAAQPVYRDLSSEFTDLNGLIRKLKSEQLNGFIDVAIGNGQESGYLFFNSGEFFGGSYTWANHGNREPGANRAILMKKVSANGGVFNVYRILPTVPSEMPAADSAGAAGKREKARITSGDEGVIVMLEEFLGIFEGVVASRKHIKTDFKTLLNKKFLENADRYVFLDPFAAEFRYENRKITLNWDIPDGELANGVIESVKELAEELNLLPRLLNHLNSWSAKFAENLEGLGIRF